MRIYLDHNATTPVRPEVADAMIEILREGHGNPSSVYEEGASARAAIEAARAAVGGLLRVSPRTIRFTSGATEANNTLLFGRLRPGDHVVTTGVEHPSVDAPLETLEAAGVSVTRVAPDEHGCVAFEAIVDAITPSTALVSMIWANNETGALQPVEAVAAVCRDRSIPFHTDATQAIGKHPVDLAQVPVDFASCSAHKLGGPKGVGALYVRDEDGVPALLQGGGQERGLRGGTENVSGIVGFGVACGRADAELADRLERDRDLRDQLWNGLQDRVAGLRWNGDPERVLANTLNVEFEGVAGEVLVQALDLEGIAVSAGAACHSGSIAPSKVLSAMGRTPTQARASLRLSVGQGLEAADIDAVLDCLARLVPRVRSMEAA